MPIDTRETRTGLVETRRYQLQWQPAFPATINGQIRMYVAGEKKKYVGDDLATSRMVRPEYAQDYNNFSKEEIIRVGHNSTIIIPFNTGVAKAQEYTPQMSNKVIEQLSLGGNTVTSFGESIKKIGLSVKVIKLGRSWEEYISAIEAVSYLSANHGRVYGSLYLMGFDAFHNGVEKYRGRYKVVVTKHDFQYRSDTNTTVTGDIQMLVTKDMSMVSGHHKQPWGAL